jgi:hypothetical protein
VLVWIGVVLLSPVVAVTVLVGAVVLMVLGFTVWRLPKEEREYEARVRAARRSLKAAEKSHQDSINAARKNVAQQEQLFNQATSSYEARLSQLRDPRGRRLASYAGYVLYELWIQTPHGEGPVAGTTATCDTAGNIAMKSRATLTRMAAGGLLLGPLGAILSLGFKKHKTVDQRELYILVEGPSVASVVQCPVNQGLAARQFAAAAVTAGLNAERIARERPAEIATVEHQLRDLRDSRGGIPAAEQAFSAATNNESRLNEIESRRSALGEIEGERATRKALIAGT